MVLNIIENNDKTENNVLHLFTDEEKNKYVLYSVGNHDEKTTVIVSQLKEGKVIDINDSNEKKKVMGYISGVAQNIENDNFKLTNELDNLYVKEESIAKFDIDNSFVKPLLSKYENYLDSKVKEETEGSTILSEALGYTEEPIEEIKEDKPIVYAEGVNVDINKKEAIKPEVRAFGFKLETIKEKEKIVEPEENELGNGMDMPTKFNEEEKTIKETSTDDNLINEIRELNDRSFALTTKLADKLVDKNNIINFEQAKNEKLNNKNKELEQRNKELEEQLANSKNNVVEFDRVKKLEEQAIENKKKTEELDRKAEKLTVLYTEMIDYKNKLEQKIKDYEIEISNLKQQLVTNAEDFRTIKEQLVEKTGKVNELQEVNDVLVGRINEVKQEQAHQLVKTA